MADVLLSTLVSSTGREMERLVASTNTGTCRCPPPPPPTSPPPPEPPPTPPPPPHLLWLWVKSSLHFSSGMLIIHLIHWGEVNNLGMICP